MAAIHRQDQVEFVEIGRAHPACPQVGDIDAARLRRRDRPVVGRLADM
jgi:hypothetical protein